MKIDSHIHTRNFSADADMSFEDILTFTETHKDTILCCTEHYDYDYPGNEISLIFDPAVYSARYHKAKCDHDESYKETEFPVLYGAELGFIEHLSEYFKEFTDSSGFDAVIGSVHTIGKFDPYFDRNFYDQDKKRAYSEYLSILIFMLKHCDAFDVMGHYDYICRYAPYDDPKMTYKDFSGHFDEIFDLLVHKNKALEFNSATSARFKKTGFDDYMPDPEIFRRFNLAGGKYVTYGSDAHSLDRLFDLYDESITFLKSSGFTELTYFRGRKPVMYDI